MPPEILGKAWPGLDIATIVELLREARDEALTWEAKADRAGSPLTKHAIRKAVCGFANSHEGGYLLLGVALQGDAHAIVGLQEPPWGDGDAAEWLTDVVRTGMRPVPWFDVRIFSDRLAVVAVDQVSEPPCITSGGTVYVRTSKSTVPVDDPADLARLYATGQAARGRAESTARAAALQLLNSGHDEWVPRDKLILTLSMVAEAIATDRSATLFGQHFGDRLPELTAGLGAGEMLSDSGAMMTQSHIVAYVRTMHEPPRGVLASWDGSVTVGVTDSNPTDALDDVLAGWLERAWRVAARTLMALGDRGPAYMTLIVNRAPERVRVERWSEARDPTESEVESVRRELRRARGDTVWEPAPAGD